MASYQTRQRDPLLDHRVQAMLERRGRELFGLFLIALSVAFALMLASYSASDPGWMIATEQPAHNVLGRLGAAIASTLMTVGGLGSWGIPTVIFAWGLRFAAHQGAERAVSRVVFAVIAVALGSVYCATLVPDASWPHSFGLGGLFGDTILASLLGIMPGSAAVSLKLLSLFVALGFLAMLLFVTGFNLRELMLITGFLALGLVVAYSGVIAALGKTASGSVSAAQSLSNRWQERRATHAERAAADYSARQTAKELARAAAIGTARMAEAVVEDDEAPEAHHAAKSNRRTAAVFQPQTESFNRPTALRADARPQAHPQHQPQPEAAHYAPPKERTSLLSRLPALMRSVVEPEHELIEPPLSADLPAPPADRISARISSAIRSRSGEADQNMSPITAAIQRREPSVTAARTPVTRAPLVADTRPTENRLSENRPTEARPTEARPTEARQTQRPLPSSPALRAAEPPVSSHHAAAHIPEEWDNEDFPSPATWDDLAEVEPDFAPSRRARQWSLTAAPQPPSCNPPSPAKPSPRVRP